MKTCWGSRDEERADGGVRCTEAAGSDRECVTLRMATAPCPRYLSFLSFFSVILWSVSLT